MSIAVDGDAGGEMTLAFELAALQRFEDPGRVFADAREWCRYVGVVANDTDAVAAFVAEHGLRQDFELGDRDIWLAMEGIHEDSDTPRQVFVGITPEHRRVADVTGWEFRRPEDVAEAAGWSLAADESTNAGFLDRLLDRLPGLG